MTEETVEEQKAVDLRDEGCQIGFDEQIIAGTLMQLRKALANAKTNFLLARAGLLKAEGPRQGVHPNTVAADIHDLRKTIDFLVTLANGVEEGNALEEPQDTGLVVAEVIPGPGLLQL